ncbi:gliding motility-associated protein GldL [Pustulibacterium marinum]|uniref:Gliding motility-associated protein GldL n=1 Tax=Pustulibacterium marinum TaxID=1224947 RepID=A0A1I7GS05_9FLAO|nr:gliding motility protein GldL [Pustulibacterium marinum]SFU51210.1 gliding motility-associated protein GldL [Pustulibacterium marinum]
MAKSKAGKKVMNMVYGLGASVVIVGALFKLTHWEFGPLNGTVLLAIGLITEALIFAIAAFEPVEEDLDWTKVYPELAGGPATSNKKAVKEVEVKEESLSKKLDNLLKEAKIDAELMSSLGSSIKNFEGAAKNIAPTVDAVATTKKYSEEMTLAATQLESLNGLYKVQLESASKQAAANEEIAANATELKTQMANLSSNLSSLNGVYGGMLSAMNRN